MAFPTTTLFALPFSLINFALIFQVTYARAVTDTYFGHTAHKPISSPPFSNPETQKAATPHPSEVTTTTTTHATHPPSSSSQPKTYGMSMRFAPGSAYDPLQVGARSHANFQENVPFALILAAGIEACGGNKRGLVTVLGLLWMARVAHYQGMKENWAYWRMAGAFGTWVMLAVLGVWGTLVGWGAWGRL